MPNIFLSCATLLLAIQYSLAQPEFKAIQRAEVMLLGSFHMHNPGADVFNPEVDDVLQNKRQEEIKNVVEALQGFSPTMIALEIKRGSSRDSAEAHHYQLFLRDSFELTRWEGHQIGFRLAKSLGHERIFNIDEPGNFPFQTMMEWAQEHNQMKWISNIMSEMEDWTEKENAMMQKETIGQTLFRENQPEKIDRGHGLYVSGAQIGRDDDFPGTDVLTEWYTRNARIFTNLYRITEGLENERILVIFGAGHAHIIRELIRVAPEFELVEANDYLKPFSSE